MINFDYSRPATAGAAIEALAKNSNAQFIAGGTNIIDLMKRTVIAPEKLVDINALELKAITKKENSIFIGALASNAAVAAHPLINSELPLLALALKAGASPQLRNMATVGGNMMQRTRCTYFYDTAMRCNKRAPGSGCDALQGYNRMHAIFGASAQCIAVHPSDMCIALAALDTTVIIQNKKGEKRIAFNDFHRLPGNDPSKDNNLQRGDLITGIEIGNTSFRKNTHYLKIRDRASYAFALVSVAVGVTLKNNNIEDVRIAMGGVAHKPWRTPEAENFLRGRQASLNNFREAASIALKNATGYGYNNFKLKLAASAITEALMAAAKTS